MIDYKIISNRIKQLRTKKGITQEKLAEMFGISTEHCCKIES